MNKNNLRKQRIYDTWIPIIKNRITKSRHGSKIINSITEEKLKNIALLAHVRFGDLARPKTILNESVATLDGTVGRPDFAFGNNPMSGLSDFYSQKGSAEVYQSLFGIFIEMTASAIIFDLMPMLVQTKSSGSIFIAEPVYSDGRLESALNKPSVIQVVADEEGTTDILGKADVGTQYTLKTADTGGENIADVTYIGRHRLNGNPVFRIVESDAYDNSGTSGTNWNDTLVKDWFDSSTNGSGIYIDAANYWSFDAATVDYVEGYTNTIVGYSGAGLNNDQPWYIGRNNGTQKSGGMSRDVGRRTQYKSMGIRTWSKNYTPDTVKVDIEFLNEDTQDAMMDHGFDLIAFGDQILADQCSQAMNDHGLHRMFALGWSHHYAMHKKDPTFNLNFVLDGSNNTGSSFSFLGKNDTLETIAGNAGILPNSNAIAENLSTLQRRLVTRMGYGSSIINNRSRRGRGDQVVMNTKYGNAIEDIRGFVAAPFENDLNDGNLAYIGTFKGMRAYVDPLMGIDDNRINISRHGGERDPGCKFAPYILAERIETIAEGTMAPKVALFSRYQIVEGGSNPELNYLTFVVEETAGYGLV